MLTNLLDFSKARVLVVGDVMLDRYWHGPVSRISPEAPVPVVHVQQSEERPGGAGNVALNIRALGAQVTLLGVVGCDHYATELIERLQAAKINCLMQHLPDSPTITKLRVLSRHQQLIRLDFEERLNSINYQQLAKDFTEQLNQTDIIILSDYGKGTLAHAIDLIKIANEKNIPILVDPKNNDFSVYQGATIITPNMKEFEEVVGHCEHESDITEKGQQLLAKYNFQALLVTRGEKGMTLIRSQQAELHIPSEAKEVYDVSGAGDTVIGTLATAYASGFNLPEAVFLANIAAGIVVGKLGTATTSLPELKQALASNKELTSGVVNEEQLILALAEAHARGERIVMTNGCFDILHAGHVYYLEEAKALGDRLIVAVNDDDSVMRLKGPGRPINSVEKRMAVLAGLASVDWVVPFSEDTPERLICKLLPDILVKGGDYKPEQIAGGKCVIANGGEVKILSFLEGHSTTSVIEKINTQK